MRHFEGLSGVSMVTAILPRQTSARVLEQVLEAGAANAFSLAARGTLIQDRWYQSLLPAMSPEQEVLRFLVPDTETDHLMEQIVMLGQLRLYGTGAIYCTRCRNVRASDDFPMWRAGDYNFESASFDILFKRNLVGLFCIAQTEQTDAITKYAIKAGAHGPTVTYTEGFGLRDRLGLLRITKKPVKEVVQVVVDACDVEPVFEAMGRAGRVEEPGRGLLYSVPVEKGLVNLASVFTTEKHSASVQQIVNAIDHLQGNSNWRSARLLIHERGKGEKGTATERAGRWVLLAGICCRKDAPVLMDAALAHGAPGASVSYHRFLELQARREPGTARINREMAFISMILPTDQVDVLREAMEREALEREMRQVCFITHPVEAVKTFAG